ncbi:MAG: cysteine--tRNA ligase [Methylocystis sp.]|nr:MAG: cysteine--tRNA ligase [Methylocystis sp.]
MSTPALRIYNTLTRTKEAFKPLDPSNVRMYVCGPTVYDYAHIGNARPLIVFDVLYRLLRHLYGADHVKYVRNITDVDDKINARAAERGITIRELTEETNNVFQADVKALGCLPPDVQPRATEHIAQMLAIIEKLIATGHAYAADGHVLFDVPSMKDYGRLSRRSLDEMLAGARVDVAPYKRGDMDFVLWKPSKENEPGWESPWGRGRPGWHIECSAMSAAHLGETFDIHGGGIDLVFPHHENEIAQSCCAFGQNVMANYWMHNGFLQVEGEKMSKSLGNFVTINELLTGWKGAPWAGSVVRLAMLNSHYRQPIDWTYELLVRSRRELWHWCQEIVHGHFGNYRVWDVDWSELAPSEGIVAALSDDLNFPLALAELRRLYANAHSGSEKARVELLMNLAFLGLIKKSTVGALSGLVTGDLIDAADTSILQKAREYQVALANENSLHALALLQKFEHEGVNLSSSDSGIVSVSNSGSGAELVEQMIAARLAARAAKNWAESDRIRDELAAMGIALKDNKDGTTTWEVKR